MDNNYHVNHWSDTMERRQNTASPAPHLNIAQSIRRSSDPHQAAVASFSRRECPHNAKYHTYYFEDGSYLTFEVSYLPVEDGSRS